MFYIFNRKKKQLSYFYSTMYMSEESRFFLMEKELQMYNYVCCVYSGDQGLA